MRVPVKTPLISFIVCVLAACADEKEGTDVASAGSDTPQVIEQEVRPDVVVLKDVDIDAKTFSAGTSVLGENDFSRLSIRSIDSSYSDGSGFKYFLVDTLYAGASVKELLIYRQYPEENIAWIVSYDPSLKILDKLQVYYDNSEGNLLVTSSIKNNMISVHTENVYSETPGGEKQKQVYAVSDNYHFIRK